MSEPQVQVSQVQTQTQSQVQEPYIDVGPENVSVVDTLNIDERLKCVIRYALSKKFFASEPEACVRLLKESFDSPAMWHLFRNIYFKGLSTIDYNNVYVVMSGERVYAPRYRHFVRERFIKHWYEYVIGLQLSGKNKGKLFIHQIADQANHSENGELPDIVTLSYRPPHDVFSLLGYEYDIELEPSIDLNNIEYRVRVQGDIVIIPGKYTHDDVKNYIMGNIRYQLNKVSEFYLARKIVDILGEVGISAQLHVIYTSDHEPRYEVIIPVRGIGEETRMYYESKLYDFLVEALEPERKWFGDHIKDIDVHVPYENTRIIRIEFLYPAFRETPPAYVEIAEKVTNEYLRLYGEYSITIGRHHIAYKGLPQHAVFNVNHETLGNVMISVDLPAREFFADEIFITHPEHEAFYWKFDGMRLISVGHVHDIAVDYENYYALRHLFNNNQH